MSSPFSRSLRAIESEPSWGWRPALVTFTLLSAWAAWFLLARVPLYETSALARLEAAAAAHPVDARTAGRTVRIQLTVGARVRVGDVLVELEGEAERLALAEAETRREALGSDVAAVRSEIAAEERAVGQEQRAAIVARDEQRAIVREVQSMLDLSTEEGKRIAQLRARGIVPELEETRARADIERRRAAADAATTALARIEQDQRTRESDRRVRIQRLRGTLSHLDGETRTIAAAVQRLEYDVERRLLRAPIDGSIAEAADLRVGSMVHEGDRLASIVPDGALRVVAQFTPASAIGRVRPGQPGRVRLIGFPWAEYGSLHATVSGVANEVRDGLVRVELAVTRVPASLPISHALPGNVEIEVERVRPAWVVLRTLGGLATRPIDAASSPPAGSQAP